MIFSGILGKHIAINGRQPISPSQENTGSTTVSLHKTNLCSLWRIQDFHGGRGPSERGAQGKFNPPPKKKLRKIWLLWGRAGGAPPP